MYLGSCKASWSRKFCGRRSCRVKVGFMQPKNWKIMKMTEKVDFWARLALEIDQGSSLRESLKDTWLVETVETDTKAAVWNNFAFTPACCWPRFGRLKKVRPKCFFEDFQDPFVGFWYPSIRMKVKYEALIMQKLSLQKILWPKFCRHTGRVHATEKLENDENERKSRFLSTFGPWNWSRVLATRIFKRHMACRDGRNRH